MNNTKRYIVTSVMAIFHNNQRYQQGDQIELTDEEASRISLYVQLDEETAAQRKQAEEEAEKARQQAEAEQAKPDTTDKKGKTQKDKDKGE